MHTYMYKTRVLYMYLFGRHSGYKRSRTARHKYLFLNENECSHIGRWMQLNGGTNLNQMTILVGTNAENTITSER